MSTRMRVIVAVVGPALAAIVLVISSGQVGERQPPETGHPPESQSTTEARGEAGVVRWGPVAEVASGPAYRGPWRMNESDFRFVDDPAVAVDAGGTIAVAWVDQSVKDVFLQVFEPDGSERFNDPVNVSESPDTFSWLPRVGFDPADPDRLYLLWQEIVFSGGSHGGEIFFARSLDGGRRFEQPRNLSNTPAGAGKGRLTRHYWHNGSLDLVVAEDSVIHIAWSEYEGALRYTRSTDGARTFEVPMEPAGALSGLPARGPSLAAGPGGAVYLAWTVGEDTGADIRFVRSADGGRSFEAPVPVGRGPGHADAPTLGVDGSGTVHLVYAESPRGPFERHTLLYSRSAPGGLSFETPREIASLPQDSAAAGFPTLAIDGAGALYLVWELFRDPREPPRGLGFSVSRDGGDTFSQPEVVPGTGDPELGFNGSQQGLFTNKLAAGPDGRFAVVNSTYRSGVASHARLIRGLTVSSGAEASDGFVERER